MINERIKNFLNACILRSKCAILMQATRTADKNYLDMHLNELKQNIYELLNDAMYFITNECNSLSACNNETLVNNCFVLLCEFYFVSVKLNYCKESEAITNIIEFKETIVNIYNRYDHDFSQSNITKTLIEVFNSMSQTSKLS